MGHRYHTGPSTQHPTCDKALRRGFANLAHIQFLLDIRYRLNFVEVRQRRLIPGGERNEGFPQCHVQVRTGRSYCRVHKPHRIKSNTYRSYGFRIPSILDHLAIRHTEEFCRIWFDTDRKRTKKIRPIPGGIGRIRVRV